MKVLFAVSEVAPIIKLGGLGDVAGSLPRALEDLDVDVDVIVPFFPVAKTKDQKLYKTFDLTVPFANETYVVEVFNTKLPESMVDVFMLKCSAIFGKGGSDAFAGDLGETEMFSFFSRAVVEFIKSRFNTYDLVHCNDWHTGLITHLLSDELLDTRPATLFTIHNLIYQGKGGLKLVEEVGIVPGSHEIIDWDIKDGDINLMLQGVASSDFVNTVSETYAKEILTSEFGGDLEEILKARTGRIEGILNGLDYSLWPRSYDVHNFKEGKAVLKEKLQRKVGLAVTPDKPLLSFIGRLDPNQKGLDVLFDTIPALVELGCQVAILGVGDKGWEEKLSNIASEQVSVNTVFDTTLAQLLYGASDFLLVPSKYEPCGLIQLIAMWYGSLPIAHSTGGLKDSITDGSTGFLFESYSSEGLLSCVNRALNVYNDSSKMSLMIKNAMQEDFSWSRSALKYKDLYERVIKLRKLAIELNDAD